MRTNNSYFPGGKFVLTACMALVVMLCVLFTAGNRIAEAKNLLAPVMLEGKWGYIDANGNVVITPRYEAAEAFSQGLAAVKQNGKRGYIDTKGNMVIAPQYNYYNGSSLIGFSEGWALVTTEEKKSFIDVKGNEVLNVSQYEAVWTFSQGLARVWVKEKKKYGYIDKRGNLFVDARYDYALDFSEEGLAAVQVDDKWGFIDTKGNWAIPPKLVSASEFHQGLACVLLSIDSGRSYIDKKGNQVISLDLNEWGRPFFQGLAAVRKNGKYGYIDTNGNMAIAAQYEGWVRDFSEGLAAVEVNHKWGFINRQGEMVIAPQYDWVWDFTRGLAAVKVNDKYGYIDVKGTMVIAPRYDQAGVFSEVSGL